VTELDNASSVWIACQEAQIACILCANTIELRHKRLVHSFVNTLLVN
jgi:hypothetical protein